MEVRITSDKFCLSPALLEHLERRLQFSFSGAHNNISLVHVRLRDLNGPRGGSGKMCQILATIPGCPKVVIKQAHEDMYISIDLAMQRAAYQAARLLLKKRQAAKPRRFSFSGMQPIASAA